MSVARALLVLALATGSVVAAPRRVLVADTDPELVHAIETSLAPWRLTVIAEGAAVDPAVASARADEADAQFIVWREGAELIVYDRSTGTMERRPVKEGPLDPVSAAAAALTVKTLMRLPDQPPDPDEIANVDEKDPAAAPPPPPDEPSGHSARFHIGLGGRFGRGSQNELGGHGAFGAMVRPSARLGWRIGLAGELRTDTEIDRAGFIGAASDEALFAVVSWTRATSSVDIEPWLAFGVTHSTLDGIESDAGPDGEARSEDAFRPATQLGVVVWWPRGGWSVGAAANVELAIGTQTYTKMTSGMGTPLIYEAPRWSGSLALVFALGR